VLNKCAAYARARDYLEISIAPALTEKQGWRSLFRGKMEEKWRARLKNGKNGVYSML
jgi:hypothetical protein